jgi:hypothetical protein
MIINDNRYRHIPGVIKANLMKSEKVGVNKPDE